MNYPAAIYEVSGKELRPAAALISAARHKPAAAEMKKKMRNRVEELDLEFY